MPVFLFSLLVVLWLMCSVFLATLLFRATSRRFESPYPLAWFRIAFSLVMLTELAQFHFFRDTAFPAQTSWVPTAAMTLDFAALILLAVGFKTTYSAWIHYILAVFLYGTTTHLEYHMDYVYVPASLLMALSPIGSVASLDSYLQKRNHSTGHIQNTPISSLYSTMFVFWCVAVVYLDSVFHKACSPMWMSGLGVWLPASIPSFAAFNHQWLLDQKWAIVSLGYFILLFEAVFIALMWWTRARIWLIACGVFLHMGIAFTFPIPIFGLGMSAFYILLLPARFCGVPKHDTHAALAPQEQPETACRHCLQPNKRVWTALLTAMFFCQGLSSAASPLSYKLLRAITTQDTNGDKAPDAPLKQQRARTNRFITVAESFGTTVLRKVSRLFLGITPHGVFMDAHMAPHGYVLAIVAIHQDGSREWLPLTQATGQPGPWATGRMWVYWTFRVTRGPLGTETQKDGIALLCNQWHNNASNDSRIARYALLQKRCVGPVEWQQGYLTAECAQEWQEVGHVTRKDGTYTVIISGTDSAEGSRIHPSAD